MFKSVQLLINQFMEISPVEDEISEQQIQIAAAALLVEMMMIDNQVHAAEREMIIAQLCNNFNLPLAEAEELITMAEGQLQEATDYFQFTSFLNKALNQDQKTRLVKYLWQVAFADGELDEYEEYMVRKVSDLLYVPHSQMIKMRNQVKDNLNL